MERNVLYTAYPKTELHIEKSLGISVLTNIQLIDYCLNNTSESIDSITELVEKLPLNIKEELHILRTVFSHGIILRDYYIKNSQNHSQEWGEFIAWWEALNDEEINGLIDYGMKESMDYYYKHLPMNQEVEEIMDAVDTNELENDTNREKALEAVLKSWSVNEINEMLRFYNDSTNVKRSIINFLNGVWEYGFKELWESNTAVINRWTKKISSLIDKEYATNEDAIFNMTGLYPDLDNRDVINKSEILTFVPVPNMGRLITFYKMGNQIFLMFEPSIIESKKSELEFETDKLYRSFEGLGDINRLQIINLLAQRYEIYAQQIVKDLNMNQSSVSRHLNMLHKANLVKIRQEGNTKYFSLNKDEVNKVISGLQSLINEK